MVTSFEFDLKDADSLEPRGISRLMPRELVYDLQTNKLQTYTLADQFTV